MHHKVFLASGDAYSRRFDEIITDVERKTKCVDDTLIWDDNLNEHWWRMIDFLTLLGNNGVILNKGKFQFAKRTVDFAGFQISKKSIKPAQKFVDADLQFPTSTKLTDVRSWFGLVNQASHYDQLSTIMEPFKRLLSPKTKFEWTPDLETAFQKSKHHVVDSIIKGVEIFDPQRYTCLQQSLHAAHQGYHVKVVLSFLDHTVYIPIRMLLLIMITINERIGYCSIM